jgi:hypothetical protein
MKVKIRAYEYAEKDCDLILGMDTNNSNFYIMPIADIEKWGNIKPLS